MELWDLSALFELLNHLSVQQKMVFPSRQVKQIKAFSGEGSCLESNSFAIVNGYFIWSSCPTLPCLIVQRSHAEIWCQKLTIYAHDNQAWCERIMEKQQMILCKVFLCAFGREMFSHIL